MTQQRAILKFEQIVTLFRDFHTALVSSHDNLCEENERLRQELRAANAANKALRHRVGGNDGV